MTIYTIYVEEATSDPKKNTKRTIAKVDTTKSAAADLVNRYSRIYSKVTSSPSVE